MIITVTPNPSLDKTVELPDPLAVGQVQRAAAQHAEPGGKGVNISRALTAAGDQTLALLPGDPADPVLTSLSEIGVAHRGLPVGEALRTNIAITDPAGTTTKINERGPQLDAAAVASFQEMILRAAQGASWTALAGSLPPGAPTDFYARLITALRESLPDDAGSASADSTGAESPGTDNTATDKAAADDSALVAVDASGEALAAAAGAGPDLIKPNAEELLELQTALCGAEQAEKPGPVEAPTDAATITPEELEIDKAQVLRLVRDCQDHGVRAALVTLGAHGALLVPAPGSGEPVLTASGPPLEVRSTVGAGDASLAGYLSAAQRGASPADRLRQAMAQGRAAASLPGSTMPGPDDLRLSDVTVAEFTPETKDTAS